MQKVWNAMCLLMLAIALTSNHLDAKKKRKTKVVVMLTNFTDCCYCKPDVSINMTYVGKAEHYLFVEKTMDVELQSILVDVEWEECPMLSYEECQPLAAFQAIDFCEALRTNRKEFWFDFLYRFEPPITCPSKKGTYRLGYKEYQDVARKAAMFAKVDSNKDSMYRLRVKIRDGHTMVMHVCLQLTGYLKEVKVN